MPPFGFFKKKDVPPSTEKKGSSNPAGNISAGAPSQASSTPPSGASISIAEAQDILREIESGMAQRLLDRLVPVKQSVDQSLSSLGRIAEEMEREPVKLEGLEQRFKSIVENSRKTVILSLKREASAELQTPRSAGDAKKFRERLEAMMNRFGEVSGSHSKMLNVFLKKHAAKMRQEFEALGDLLKDTRAALADFEQERAPVVKCASTLNTASQLASSIRSGEAAVQSAERQGEELEREIEQELAELESLKGSEGYQEAEALLLKIAEADKREQEFRARVSELFSHASRAFAKYSYGVGKETESRLRMMTEEPWKILEQQDLSPYSELLSELRKSVGLGKVQLKDSDKVVHHIDVIVSLLPELRGKARELAAGTESLRRADPSGEKRKIVDRAGSLQQTVDRMQEELAQIRQSAEQHRKQVHEKTAEVAALLKEAQDSLFGLAGKRYSLRY